MAITPAELRDAARWQEVAIQGVLLPPEARDAINEGIRNQRAAARRIDELTTKVGKLEAQLAARP